MLHPAVRPRIRIWAFYSQTSLSSESCCVVDAGALHRREEDYQKKRPSRIHVMVASDFDVKDEVERRAAA